MTEKLMKTRSIETTDAGASTQREYERRAANHSQQIADTRTKGADGEHRLAHQLKRELSDTSVVLNDRKARSTEGTIDHIAVTSGGVWIVDVESSTGMVERRDVGSRFKPDVRLFINGWESSKAVRGMAWQHQAVTEALVSLGRPEVPVYQALCFTNAEWPRFKKPGQVGGVWIVGTHKLVEIANEKTLLEEGDIANLAMHLSMIFPKTS